MLFVFIINFKPPLLSPVYTHITGMQYVLKCTMCSKMYLKYGCTGSGFDERCLSKVELLFPCSLLMAQPEMMGFCSDCCLVV